MMLADVGKIGPFMVFMWLRNNWCFGVNVLFYYCSYFEI